MAAFYLWMPKRVEWPHLFDVLCRYGSNQINFIYIAPFINVKIQPKVLYIKRKKNETNPLNIPTPRTPHACNTSILH